MGLEIVPVGDAAIERAAESLLGGDVIVVPTDTLYGLACSCVVPGATEKIFAAKGRPRDVALPVFVASASQAMELCTEEKGAPALMKAFWPGALTIVMRRRPGFTTDLGGDGSTVGLRVPDDKVMGALVALIGPIAVTSANAHGKATPETALSVVDMLGDEVTLVIDGGRRSGEPSTVVDLTGPEPRLIREGRIPWGDVVAALAET